MPLKPFPLNFTLTAGDDEPLSWTYKRNGVYEDISTWQFWLTIKADKDADDSTAIVQLNPDDFTVDTPPAPHPGNGTDCRVSCLVPRANTDVAEGDYYVDLQVMETTLVQTHGKGTCTVDWQATKRTS